ncbi:hypothetical protein FNT36_21080 [Hymenobacter setariae]|uniref:DUF2157 domain-containing protein n=1 Tax=Hymenobacter setariae TaxID=2594794 RepID=A0A558BME8_9BACT|nr:hypothetical protein [Hymenobacter setariae]TVT37670.1 hypothetical protein FNT36_21080 [Hymenobacter setariae]
MNTKAYPATWAQGDAVRAAASRWQRRGLLTPAQRATIEAAHPVTYYRPNNWIRVLLFVVTLLGAGTAMASATITTAFELGPVAYALLTLIGHLAALELLIKKSRYYRSGVDNALLYGALLAWAFLIACLGRDTDPSALTDPALWRWLVPVLLALLAALVRYADPLVAATSFAAAFALLFNVLLQSALGRLLLPFGMMAAAGALLLALRQLPARDDYFYYRSAGLVLRTLGLAVFYLAGNYLVVREGNAQLLGGGGPSTQIPLAPLFYVFTAGIPLVYIGLALRRHDRLLLTLGLLALAFSIFTLRNYRSLLPPEIAATVGGAVLLLGALAALRYLRTPRHGLTAAADAEARPYFNLESLVVAETAHAPAAPEPGFEFGGGHSGGGGADSSY